MKTIDDALADALIALLDYSKDLFSADQVTLSVDVGETMQALRDGVELQQRKLALLCPHVADLVNICAEIVPPMSCKLSISAHPDIFLERSDGHWVAFQRAQSLSDVDGAPLWVAWRGSMSGDVRVGTLQQVVDFYGTREVPAA